MLRRAFISLQKAALLLKTHGFLFSVAYICQILSKYECISQVHAFDPPFLGTLFCAKDAQARAIGIPGSNAFVPASIHNIGFPVKNIVNDIQFQTAKKVRKNIF
jgi:hypothetical protein